MEKTSEQVDVHLHLVVNINKEGSFEEQKDK